MKEYKSKIFIFERKENDDKDSLYKIFEEVQEVIKKKGGGRKKKEEKVIQEFALID